MNYINDWTERNSDNVDTKFLEELLADKGDRDYHAKVDDEACEKGNGLIDQREMDDARDIAKEQYKRSREGMMEAESNEEAGDTKVQNMKKRRM